MFRIENIFQIYSKKMVMGKNLFCNCHSSVEDMTLLPPTGFSDSRELSEAECDRDRHRDRGRELDWQTTSAAIRHGGSLGRLPIEAVETMLAR